MVGFPPGYLGAPTSPFCKGRQRNTGMGRLFLVSRLTSAIDDVYWAMLFLKEKSPSVPLVLTLALRIGKMMMRTHS